MKVAYVTDFTAEDIHQWSGTGYYIGQSLRNQGILLEYIGSLKDRLAHKAICKSKRHYHELFGRYYIQNPWTILAISI